MTSPTQRSLKLLRERGYTVQVVERWNSFAHIRQDLFGFIDLVAIRASERGVTAIQTTSGSNVAARMLKIRQEPRAGIWLAAGNRIVIHGWRKAGERGKVKRWECREVPVVFAEHETEATPRVAK